MQRIDRWLIEWAESVIAESANSNLSGINTVEKLLRDPGHTTGLSGHKVLWWPKNHRVAKISKAVHQINPVDRVILIIHYGYLPHEGRKMTLRDLVRNSSLTMSEVRDRRRKARRKINNLTNKRAECQKK